ncbi:MAG: putative toxin-antitoxin system toxin component, PIN family [Syntrophobacteraceae bacterium]|jgi:putative PIN family toxin of toxin-antitoxin system|nr:putative toxin-antitoxin system toxin component, PIN family [Syntrophobacteraceae bacterium]
MIKVVLDTNVLVSALLKSDSIPDLLVSLILEKRALLCLTDSIVLEYEEVLAREKFKKLNRQKVAELIARLRSAALWVEPRIRLNAARHDPEDNKFLECALEAQADFLITGNIKHFPPKRFKKTLIVSPAEFLAVMVKVFRL